MMGKVSSLLLLLVLVHAVMAIPLHKLQRRDSDWDGSTAAGDPEHDGDDGGDDVAPDAKDVAMVGKKLSSRGVRGLVRRSPQWDTSTTGSSSFSLENARHTHLERRSPQSEDGESQRFELQNDNGDKMGDGPLVNPFALKPKGNAPKLVRRVWDSSTSANNNFDAINHGISAPFADDDDEPVTVKPKLQRRSMKGCKIGCKMPHMHHFEDAELVRRDIWDDSSEAYDDMEFENQGGMAAPMEPEDAFHK
jgi:hypothetical protein